MDVGMDTSVIFKGKVINMDDKLETVGDATDEMEEPMETNTNTSINLELDEATPVSLTPGQRKGRTTTYGKDNTSADEHKGPSNRQKQLAVIARNTGMKALASTRRRDLTAA